MSWLDDHMVERSSDNLVNPFDKISIWNVKNSSEWESDNQQKVNEKKKMNEKLFQLKFSLMKIKINELKLKEWLAYSNRINLWWFVLERDNTTNYRISKSLIKQIKANLMAVSQYWIINSCMLIV